MHRKYCTGTMHELSIAMSLIDVAADEAQRRGAHVRAVHVKIGLLSGVVKEALFSAYELAREGTELADSRLVVEDVPIVVYCEHCRAERAADTIEFMRCSGCGTLADRIVAGRELEMTALEIEQR